LGLAKPKYENGSERFGAVFINVLAHSSGDVQISPTLSSRPEQIITSDDLWSGELALSEVEGDLVFF